MLLYLKLQQKQITTFSEKAAYLILRNCRAYEFVAGQSPKITFQFPDSADERSGSVSIFSIQLRKAEWRRSQYAGNEGSVLILLAASQSLSVDWYLSSLGKSPEYNCLHQCSFSAPLSYCHGLVTGLLKDGNVTGLLQN